MKNKPSSVQSKSIQISDFWNFLWDFFSKMRKLSQHVLGTLIWKLIRHVSIFHPSLHHPQWVGNSLLPMGGSLSPHGISTVFRVSNGENWDQQEWHRNCPQQQKKKRILQIPENEAEMQPACVQRTLPGVQSCGIVPKVATTSTGIPFGHQFKTWLFHFWSSSLLIYLGK